MLHNNNLDFRFNLIRIKEGLTVDYTEEQKTFINSFNEKESKNKDIKVINISSSGNWVVS